HLSHCVRMAATNVPVCRGACLTCDTQEPPPCATEGGRRGAFPAPSSRLEAFFRFSSLTWAGVSDMLPLVHPPGLCRKARTLRRVFSFLHFALRCGNEVHQAFSHA